jgi:DNA repair exonuclease SbcCD ATPase subunit
MNDFETLNRFLDKYVNDDTDQPGAWAALDRIEAEMKRLKDDDDYDERTYRNALNACEARENSLVAENDRLRTAWETAETAVRERDNDIDKLEAEVERLRAALERVDEHVRRWPLGHLDSGCVNVVRAALAEEKGDR